jgi:hypothetical protein
MNILLIDNRDSFTFNLADACKRQGANIETVRNDIDAGQALAGDAGCCLDLIRLAKGTVTVLGICLGHQAIVLEAGGEIGPANDIAHGKSSLLHHDRQGPNADPMRAGPAGTEFLGNQGGGIIGGISTGAPIVVRAAFKPTPSIRKPLHTIDAQGRSQLVSTLGRHDLCVALRAGPIVEAMAALVLADQMLLHRGQCGR